MSFVPKILEFSFKIMRLKKIKINMSCVSLVCFLVFDSVVTSQFEVFFPGT